MNDYEIKEKTLGEAMDFLDNYRADLLLLKLHEQEKVLAKTQKKLTEIMNVLMEYDF